MLSVQAKAGPGRYAATDPLSLANARARLTGGEAAGVQVHYRYDGHEWTDTVLRTAGGYRLVRCRVPTSG